MASLTDPDGGITVTKWEWATAVFTPGTPGTCATTFNTGDIIENASSAAYTPKAEDYAENGAGTSCLQARATYTDNIPGDADPAESTDNDDDPNTPPNMDGVYASTSSEAAIQESDPANTAPKFPDQDLVTPDDQSDETSRSVAENEDAGENVGASVEAGDADLLLYALGGADADSFKVDNNGQITTKVKLDYEARSSYMVYVMASDPSGASDAIIVNISVTDENDPADIAGPSAADYAENGVDAVATYTADDQDGDAIVWSVGGDDAGKFTIDGGVLAFKDSPDYEKPDSESAGTRADQNVYNVTVQATGGMKEVVVTVTNVDEDGKVTLDKPQPQASRGLEATLTDQDSPPTNQAWQWARSADGDTWEDIMGATSQSRSPSADDVGSYLRASVTYTDLFGSGKTASAVTANPVEARTVANASPSFADQDGDEETDGIQIVRSIAENTAAATNIGKAVSATDADSDVLIYGLSGADADFFDINTGTGQLKTKDKLDFEAEGSATTNNAYVVTVTATDPSGADAMNSVTINVTDANEAATFDAGDSVLTDVNVVENTTDLRGGADGTDALSGTPFGTDDPDATETGEPDLTLEGADEKYFAITNDGVLSIDAAQGEGDADDFSPNFEDQSSFSITIVATSGEDNRLLRSRLDVTVHVIDAEDTRYGHVVPAGTPGGSDRGSHGQRPRRRCNRDSVDVGNRARSQQCLPCCRWW